MKHFRLIVIGLLLATIVGCVSVLTLEDVSKLRKGMTPYEAREISKLEPLYKFNFQFPKTDGEDIEALVYELSSGTYKSNYYYLFINDALEFWGYPHEFARSTKKQINEIGKKINEKTKVAEEEKKAAMKLNNRENF